MNTPSLAILIVGTLISFALGYPSGAPETVCDNQEPGHGTKSQDLKSSPYRVDISPNLVRGGQNVAVTIRGASFVGFMVSARDGNNKIVNGYFHTNENDKTKPLNCFGQNANTATHTTNSARDTLTLYWTAPEGYQGRVVFKATVIKSGLVYWSNIPSKTALTIQ